MESKPLKGNKIPLNSPLSVLPGIGPKKEKILQKNGIGDIRDILLYFPRRYLDRSEFKSLQECKPGEMANAEIQIADLQVSGYGRKKRLVVEVFDDTAIGLLTFFHGVDFYAKKFRAGDLYFLSGKVGSYRGRIQFIHPDLEFAGYNTQNDQAREAGVHFGRIIPVYPLNENFRKNGIDSRVLRNALSFLCETNLDLSDPLPPDILKKNDLIQLREAISFMHFPKAYEELNQAKRRIAFQELMMLGLHLEGVKSQRKRQDKNRNYITGKKKYHEFLKKLPFELTADQLKTLDEILSDLDSKSPMLRLLEGEVGSGKTIVALAAMVYVSQAGYQSAIMAPTEVLAKQHIRSFNKFLQPVGITTGVLLGGNYQGKNETLRKLSDGALKIVVGTHALIQKNVSFKNLALVIIDEQHRFGVDQRSALISKGSFVDSLVMTATPIPRSLSLTAFGQMRLSQIKKLPKGRESVQTLIFGDDRRNNVYNSLKKYMDQKRQIYYLFPVIEESEESDLKSLEEGYKNLSKNIFPGYRLAMLHGKMHSTNKNEAMKLYESGYTQLLVTTTVVEVGIDVPNANVMVIEHPERFGLSQLHQLRGRVGRGKGPAFCVLIVSKERQPGATQRLEEFAKIQDGFAIAELDLAIRGPGDFLGNRQHGLPPFRVADISRDFVLLKKATALSKQIIAEDPLLESPKWQQLGLFLKTNDWLELGKLIS